MRTSDGGSAAAAGVGALACGGVGAGAGALDGGGVGDPGGISSGGGVLVLVVVTDFQKDTVIEPHVWSVQGFVSTYQVAPGTGELQAGKGC